MFHWLLSVIRRVNLEVYGFQLYIGEHDMEEIIKYQLIRYTEFYVKSSIILSYPLFGFHKLPNALNSEFDKKAGFELTLELRQIDLTEYL